MLNNLIAIFVGGGTGAILRYLTTYLCKSVFGLSFIGTISVNMIGCLLIGFIFGIVSKNHQCWFSVHKCGTDGVISIGIEAFGCIREANIPRKNGIFIPKMASLFSASFVSWLMVLSPYQMVEILSYIPKQPLHLLMQMQAQSSRRYPTGYSLRLW